MPKRPPRILFDAHSLLGRKTGVGYYTDQLVRELARQHPEIEFVGYYHNFLYRKQTPDLPSAPNIRYRRIAFIPGQVVNLLRRFRILLPVELLTLTRADFILYPNFLGLSSLFGTPCASVIHDLTFVDLPEYVSKRNLYDLRHFIPAQIRRSSFIVTVSEFSKQRIHNEFKVPLSNIMVTPIPPEPPRAYSTSEQRKHLHELGITGSYFLTLSTVEPRKNVLGMLDAYLQLPEKLQHKYKLVITGMFGWNCEEEIARLHQLKTEGKNILHVGYATHEQRAALYQGTAFYTSASHYEGFGMTPLEAMSYQKACALSDIPIFHEAAGQAALYFNQNDPANIAKAWQTLLTDTTVLRRLAAAGKAQATTYHWDAIIARLYARIAKTMKGN